VEGEFVLLGKTDIEDDRRTGEEKGKRVFYEELPHAVKKLEFDNIIIHNSLFYKEENPIT
jgi:hypothetical protein